MNKWILALVAAAAGVFLWVHFHSSQPDSARSPIAITSPTETTPVAPHTQYPVPTETPQADSAQAQQAVTSPADNSIEAALSALFGKDKFEAVFNIKDLVRRIVVTVDNATKLQQPSQEFSPFKPMEIEFVATGKGADQSISPRNFERYKPYVDLVRNTDMHQIAKLYVRYYSLFQSAYQDLGTQGYFNDRLIEVIDHILSTPDVKSPIKIHQPTYKYRYKYVDDQIEALSSSQKLLIRTGEDNAQVIKAKLRELRPLLIKK
jgi:hypothetical protein